MSADFYRVVFWAVAIVVVAQAVFLHVDAANINDLKARVAALEAYVPS